MNLNERSEALAALALALDDRRLHDRVTGPFDGRRVNALETPVRIFDLSEGGCFVNSLHDQQPDVHFVLQIELPYEGRVTLTARTLYRKPGFGFAVCFTEVTDEGLTRLRRTVERLKRRQPYDF
ncbi:MAG: hypothetical protein A3H97_13565 [Acidobacteria bacterium RIFCSPLOWO2_02_FULL_65_29]|nr:MAG: hypothetical protein A3H97_13565 [Acidobacteria bacterium RIFCSPLOWO2_02_FULL_65_29]